MLGEKHADDFYSTWEWVTNRMGSEDMTPHLVEKLNREHPTLRQQMVAMMVSLLNGIDPNHGCDARCAASCAFVSHFQEWLKEFNEMANFTSHTKSGEIRFPFI